MTQKIDCYKTYQELAHYYFHSSSYPMYKLRKYY